MTSYWTQTTTYGDIEINWEYKEEATTKEASLLISN